MGLISNIKNTVNKSTAPSETIIQLGLDKVKSDKNQVRKHFDEESLKELADSIKANGVISPIIVRANGDNYQIVAGERRFRASELAGKKTIPAIVMDIDNEKAKTMQLVENLQREDITAIEVAMGFAELKKLGMTQDAIADKIGMSKANVSKYVAVSKMPEINEIMEKRRDASLLDLYEIAKEQNTKKRNRMVGDIVGDIDKIETEDKELPVAEDDDPQDEDQDLDYQKAWDYIRKDIKKDPVNLLKYISKKRLEKILRKL